MARRRLVAALAALTVLAGCGTANDPQEAAPSASTVAIAQANGTIE